MKNYFRFVVFVLLGLLNTQWTSAQDVTVSPTTGKMITAYSSNQQETGFQNGLSALWRHEQLPLTFTTSDNNTLTNGGEFNQPTSNMCVVNNQIVVLGGQSADCFWILSLPKGYRITGYKIVVLNNLNSTTVSGLGTGAVTKTLYETDKTWNTGSPKAQTDEMGNTNDTKEYVLERHSSDPATMGNQLYFRLTHDVNSYYGVTIKSFEVYFTAEGSFDVDVVPENVGQARSVVTAAFQTSKMDIGGITQYTKGNRTYYAYNYNNVTDITGYNYIYQDDAIQDGKAADIAENKHIYPVRTGGQNYYAFGNGTYYIESPTIVHSQTGLEIPVGYRIVGAKFNYLWGTATNPSTTTRTVYYIRYRSGYRWYYLNDQLQFTRTEYAWTIDDAKNLCTDDGRYLACTGEGNTRTLSFSTSADNWYNLKAFEVGNNTYVGWEDGWFFLRGETSSSTTPSVTKYTSSSTSAPNNAATVFQTTGQITTPGYTPGPYTLTLYDKTGAVLETITVNQGGTGTKDIGKCNNDAVKFTISGLGEGRSALIKPIISLEALDPYINSMNIICHDPNNILSLSQSFTASDFSVSGGKFTFYVPTDYMEADLTFTFSDLYSKYGDNTYYGNTSSTNNGRYSFVTSDYFMPINGNGNGGLYDAAYNPNATYDNKVVTSTAGNIRFKFNNAEDLKNTGTSTQAKRYLQEYPFSAAAYVGSADPDGTSTTGDFIACTLNASESKSETFYVFTADETRYNIAPTTAWQHRSYAFYRMDVELEAHAYTPTLSWTKLYDATSYYKDGEADDSMWGLKLGTTPAKGYLSVQEILNSIAARTADNNAAPKNTDQILYIDGSDLVSIINSSETTTTTNEETGETETITTIKDLSTLKGTLGANALIFLPTGSTSKINNVAYKTATGDYRAGDNIVLTDRKPFYSPYDIIVEQGSYATYTRNITWPSNGKTALATVMVPFTLNVTDGVHKEPTNSPFPGCTFTVNKMNATSCMSVNQAVDAEAKDFYATGYFTPVTGETTEANVPYMINVTSAPGDQNVPFAATQFGALVKATTAATTDNPQGMQTDYTFNGESAIGKIVNSGISFQNHGSYSGKKLTASAGYFYFAGGMYLNSKNIRPEVSQYLYMYPFRGYYTYSGGGTGNAKMMLGFDIVFGENTTTGINDLTDKAVADLVAIPGRGTITFKATADNDVQIVNVNGTKVGRVVIGAGETQTVNVPAGLYIVNGAKLIVK